MQYKHWIIRDSLLGLFALYNIQGWLYEQGSFLSRSCILGIILISGIYFIKTLLIKNKNNMFYNAWTILLMINVIGFLFIFDLSAGPSRNMFKQILCTMLSFYSFYYFATRDEIKPNHMIRFLIIMIPIYIVRFFINESIILDERISDDTSLVNNVSYSFVNLIPFVFLIKNKKLISGILLTLLLFFIINGAKRGAIISGAIGTTMYFFYLIKTLEKRRRIFGYVASIMVILVLSVFIYRISLTNEFMINRMASMLEGNTSGRTSIYQTLFNAWFHSDNIFNLIFGYGFGASVKIAGILAHSDWFELLSNFGIIGVFSYMFLFYSTLSYFRNKEWMTDRKILFFTITIMWFFSSLVSMWYLSSGGFTYSVLLGYLIGKKSNTLD